MYCVTLTEYDGVIVTVSELSTTLPYENDMKEIKIHICVVLDTCGPFEYFAISIFSRSVATMRKNPGFSPIQ